MSNNPYAAPDVFQTPAQNAKREIWTKELKSARTVLIVVGVIQLLFGIWHLSNVRSSFDEAVTAEVAKQPGMVVDQDKLAEAFAEQKTLLYTLSSLPAAFGIFLFVMAALVFKFPVGVTLSSLIVFCVMHLADAVVDPTMILRGILLKILFIVILLSAFRSARRARQALA